MLETDKSTYILFSIAVLTFSGKSYVAFMSTEKSIHMSIRGYNIYKQIKGSVICGNYG